MALATQQFGAKRAKRPTKSWFVISPTIWQPVVFFGLLFVAWEVAVTAFNVRPYLLPRFSVVASALWTARVDLFHNVGITMVEVAFGFAAAVIGGALLGIVIYASPVARRTIYPFVTALQAMPKSALAPLMVVWFGYGLFSKSAMAFLFAFFPIVVATLGGFLGTPANLEEHFRALRASSWQTFAMLRLPAALPIFIDGCKVAMPLAIIGAIIGEFVGSQDGLGNYLMMAASSSRTDLMFAAILVITATSMILYWLLEILSRWVWWRGIQF